MENAPRQDPSPDERLYVRLLCRLVTLYPRATWSAHCQHGAAYYAVARPVLAAWLADVAVQYEALLPTTAGNETHL